MNRTALRIGAAALGVMMLTGLAATATAAAAPKDTGDVDVSVTVTPVTTPGVLAMSVSAASATLTENGSDNSARVFTGQLPAVTVTDTRKPAEIPTGAAWYVIGTATDFSATGGASISKANLGWAPKLINGGASGLVSEGDPVAPQRDGGPGLVDKDLLAMAADSGQIAPEGTWTASADLTLKTGTDVQAGAYHATVTLSLFE